MVVQNINPPYKLPNDINAPPGIDPAAKLANTSGAPFANAIKVTAANAGDRLNLSDKDYIPTHK